MEIRQPEVVCPQCGAAVPLADGDSFVACPHCRASLYVDLGRLVRHVVVAPLLGAGEARGALERFLAAAEVEIAGRGASSVLLEYLPWYVVPAADAPVFVAASPEAALAVRPRSARDVGTASPFDATKLGGADVVAPTLALEDAVAETEGGRVPGAQLLHVPVWRIDFADGSARYTVYVDAVDGEVSATKLPPASSRRMDRVATMWLTGAIVLFAVEAAVLPGVLLPGAAFVATGAAIYWFVGLGERRGP